MGEPGAGSNEQPSTSSSSSAAGACGGSNVDLSDPALAGMTADELKKFIDTGRTGRRNAVPDVGENASLASTSGVAEALGALSVKDEPGASSSSSAGKSS